MSSRIGLCSFVGGVVLFLCGALAWTVLPFRQDNLQAFEDEDAVAFALTENAKTHGVYAYPMDQEKLAKGPFAFVVFRPGETFPMTQLMIRGLLTSILAAGLITNLLLQSKVETYGGRVLFCVVVCLTGGVLVRLSDWNWWYYPASFVLLELVQLVVSGAAVGLVIGKLIVPGKKTDDSKPNLARAD